MGNKGEQVLSMDPEEEFPEELYCPVTQTLMRDPVVTTDGHSYEREFIEEWFRRGRDTSPLTNLRLDSQLLIPNLALKKLIASMTAGSKLFSNRANKKKDYKQIVFELGRMWDEKNVSQEKVCLLCSRSVRKENFSVELGLCLICIEKQQSLGKKQMKNSEEQRVDKQMKNYEQRVDKYRIEYSWVQRLTLIKRDYFSEKPQKFMKKFWEEFDTAVCSLWRVEYELDPTQGKAEFLTYLLNTFLMRWEPIKHDTFGVMGVYGKRGRYSIKGVVIWPGPFKHPFCESQMFDFVNLSRLDPTSEIDRMKVEEFWSRIEEGVVEGQPVCRVKFVM